MLYNKVENPHNGLSAVMVLKYTFKLVRLFMDIKGGNYVTFITKVMMGPHTK